MPIETLGKDLASLEENFPQAQIYGERQEMAIRRSEQLTGENLKVEEACKKRLAKEFSALGIPLGNFPIVREASREVMLLFKGIPVDGVQEVGVILVAIEHDELRNFALKQGFTEQEATLMTTYVKQNTIMHELYHGTSSYDTIASKDYVGERTFMRHGAIIQGSGKAWEEGLACLWATKIESELKCPIEFM